MLMCKQAEKGVPLQAEQANWLEETNEEIDEQELEAYYSFMAKIQEVLPAESGSDAKPLEKVQYDAEYNMFANERQHSEQPESINDTHVVEKDNSQADQNTKECDDERAVLANLIKNLKHVAEENKKIQKQLKNQTNHSLINYKIASLHLKSANLDPTCQMFHRPLILMKIVKLILFIVDSGCTKHMTGNLKLLCNFVQKYLGTVRFENDQFALILGYGDLVQGNITIKRVYYVEGLNHNLFSIGQFCDADLEVASRKSIYFVRDLQGNDLLTGNRGFDLYTISLQETSSPTLICFLDKVLPTQAWLWHRRLSHLNFDTINLLSKKNIMNGLPKLKYVKD
uniref:Integrase, catalytic region, zinc finger, CCHC-type, peptidase aspartic, catalytic n=1 Tax=Tanacetum cinerariifolium TaxID=118510 RepID=A0A6L2M6Q8_TANCI|nr:integrase, catalytic region, zinc finger, CCHC-type, peptidase aspartic, catalytic [Tanacetum cinerariifolium]